MIEMRDNEIAAQRQIFEAEMQAKDRERHSLRTKLEQAQSKISELQEANERTRASLEEDYRVRESALRDDFEKRLNSYEDILNEKTAQNESLST